FLQDQKVSAAALGKFQEFQSAQKAAENCKKGLKQIEELLSRADLPTLGSDTLLRPGESLDRQSEVILANIPGNKGSTAPLPTSPTGDIRELLKAFLNK